MRCSLAIAAIFAAACYGPSAQPGAPCGPGDECPTGQECRAGTCFVVGAPSDSNPFDDSEMFDAPGDTSQIVADAPIDGPPYIPWGTPTLLTTLETPGAGEDDPSVTTNKLTVVFTADTAVNDSDIYIATRSAVTDTFSFSLLTAVNAVGFNEVSPEISGDGNTLYFTSNRSGNEEIYKSTFTTSWSAPVIATDLSSTSSDGDVAISPDGLTAVVVRNGTPNRMYVYTRASTAVTFSAPAIHTELNVTDDIAAPSITNGAAIIYLHAGAIRDLYRATRNTNGTFTTPVPVSELNTVNVRDAAPFVLETDDYLIFSRAGNIYETVR